MRFFHLHELSCSPKALDLDGCFGKEKPPPSSWWLSCVGVLSDRALRLSLNISELMQNYWPIEWVADRLMLGAFLKGGERNGVTPHLCGKSVRTRASHRWHTCLPTNHFVRCVKIKFNAPKSQRLLRCAIAMSPSQTPEIASDFWEDNAMLHCDVRMRWKTLAIVISSCDVWVGEDSLSTVWLPHVRWSRSGHTFRGITGFDPFTGLGACWQCDDNSWPAFTDSADGKCTNHAWIGAWGWMVISLFSGWTAQARDMIGTLQQGVRALLTRANTLPLKLKGHADELARLNAQLHYQKRSNHEMKTTLQNQSFPMPSNTSDKWQMTGSEAQTCIQRTRSQSEDSVRREMTAIERFESRRQQEYECRIRDHVLALLRYEASARTPTGITAWIARVTHDCSTHRSSLWSACSTVCEEWWGTIGGQPDEWNPGGDDCIEAETPRAGACSASTTTWRWAYHSAKGLRNSAQCGHHIDSAAWCREA